MDLQTVLNRFPSSSFVLYGGNEILLKTIQGINTSVTTAEPQIPIRNVLYWFTEERDEKSIPPKQTYDKLFEVIIDAIYIIVGNGYAGRERAENAASRILRSLDNKQKVIIFHGYSGFVTEGSRMSKEEYIGGSIIAPEDDRILYLQELASALKPTLHIPVPLRISDLQEGSQFLEEVKPLIRNLHLVSRIEENKKNTGIAAIPLSTSQPTDVIDMQDITKQKDYNPDEWTSAVYWGQRKLLISEIELLVEVIRRDISVGGNGKDFIIVYVGAAPGSHFPHLLNLFRARYSIKAHLWDRRSRFDAIESTDIRIIPKEFEDPSTIGTDREGFFTDVVMENYLKTYGTNNKIIFISDIRDQANEKAIDMDMKLQQSWVLKLNPYASQLKFRLPFLDKNAYPYLSGQIYTQAWARVKGSETRLLSFRPYTTATYVTKDYDRIMSFFNTVTRMTSYDIGNIVSNTYSRYISSSIPVRPISIPSYIPMIDEGICTCHDCSREIQVITKYLSSLGSTPTVPIIMRLVKDNTEACRPRGDKSNKRTLWNRVTPKVPPSDRKNIVVYKQLPPDANEFGQALSKEWIKRINTSGTSIENPEIMMVDTPIDNLRVSNLSKILIYGDGLSIEQIISLFLSKKQLPIITIDNWVGSSDSPMMIMRQVLLGKRFNIVVNFHSDFIPKYDPQKDLGTVGYTQYRHLLQNIEISKNIPNVPNLDIWGHFILFVLTRLSRK